ncbi:MAG: mannose-6-phosphate isomerase, class I [Parafilimonas sp.]
MIQDKIFKLKGKVQHYAWGGIDFIPKWLGIANEDRKPFAEYWMGAHPSASSALIINGKEESLYKLIKKDPEQFLGIKVKEQFEELPYLFKILDVKDMLSIQVHPTKEEAAKGFEEENAKGIYINAPHRNYKDKNHKPEVMVALSEFWLLHGFLQEDKLLKVLQAVPEFKGFENLVLQKGYKGLYEYVMTMPQLQVDRLLGSLVERELKNKLENKLSKYNPGWWVAKLYEQENKFANIDRGIFSIYFFNIAKINPGEAVFQAAGVPHAYLEGQNVELMANSDNVLRGGLTPKHVDVPELMKHIIFEGIQPNFMKGIPLTRGEINYPCTVDDFGISKIELNVNENYESEAQSLEIIVIIEGELNTTGSNSLIAQKGETIAILQGETYNISTQKHLLAYKAFVP